MSLYGITLDTGALLCLDQPSKSLEIQQRLRHARERGNGISVPTAVVAQAWRSARQVHLARLLKTKDIEFVGLTVRQARAVGAACAECGHNDVVDVQVALCAKERGHAVVTSDPDDFARIDPTLPVIRI